MLLGKILKPRWYRIAIAAFLTSSFFYAGAVQAKNEYNEADLKVFLQDYLKLGEFIDKSTRYSIDAVSLNGQDKSLFVYITGNTWCGTGGCTAIILKPKEKSFKAINKFTLVRLPILVLHTKTHGWYDIAMPARGEGTTVKRFALLKFSGTKYPSNPSTAPLAKPSDVSKGDLLQLDYTGYPVY